MIDSTTPLPLPPGVSQRQIAAHIGVSVSTVSRALSGHPAVSERTRADVLRAIEELRVDAAPGRRATAVAGNVIGLTNSHLAGGRFPAAGETMLHEILGGAETAAQKRGYRVYTWHNSGLLLDAEGETFFSTVRGVVMTGGVVAPEVVEVIHRHGLPCAIIGGHVPAYAIPSVSGDAFRGTYLAVQHLVGLGHRRIALVNGPVETYTTQERRAGYLEALFDAGLPIERALIRWRDGVKGFGPEAGQEATRELLDLEAPPTAIVFASDNLAVGGQGVCQQRGLRVPEDISIVGFDDHAVAQATTPQLTTIRVDRVSWGARAIERLIDSLEGKPLMPERLLMPVELVVRSSTGPVPAGRGAE
ncbi:MAG TPA: LacI family DNA-binding transcriptional regulator [Thermomicrobiales bacterium]|nr:LacI family DNA-binding transcriptional regulator [Thermomicrobiales bacterium]